MDFEAYESCLDEVLDTDSRFTWRLRFYPRLEVDKFMGLAMLFAEFIDGNFNDEICFWEFYIDIVVSSVVFYGNLYYKNASFLLFVGETSTLLGINPFIAPNAYYLEF